MCIRDRGMSGCLGGILVNHVQYLVATAGFLLDVIVNTSVVMWYLCIINVWYMYGPCSYLYLLLQQVSL